MLKLPETIPGPHRGQPVLTAGLALDQAKAAMLMVHGRGATAASILSLVEVIGQPGFAYLAPQASNDTWYPNSFLAPIPSNEPGITSGLAALASLVEYLTGAGIPAERIMLLGFSQGACLTLEFVARNARRYGGVAGLSGGLIGPDGTPRDYPAGLADTPIFLGCSDTDFHIPKTRVELSAQVLQRLGGNVTVRLYPGMGHGVNQDEIDFVKKMMATLSPQAS
jgi:predicted esterase